MCSRDNIDKFIEFTFPNVNFKNENLCSAILGRRFEIAQALLLLGASVDERSNEYEWTPLMFAVAMKLEKEVLLLVDFGANPLAVDKKDGTTPLLLATPGTIIYYYLSNAQYITNQFMRALVLERYVIAKFYIYLEPNQKNKQIMEKIYNDHRNNVLDK